jgi:transglutaminase-like putative cysteine protease
VEAVRGNSQVTDVAIFDRPIPGGMQGLRDTVRAMSALACQGSRDHAIIALAHDLQNSRILKTLENVLAFAVHNVRYVLDPDGMELVQTPVRTLMDARGDCDDFSVLIAAILRAGSIPVRFAVVKTPGHEFFNHVFPEASTDDGTTWFALDGTLPAPRVGRVAPEIIARTTVKFRCPA